MDRLNWTEELTVGLPILDEQHKHLFAISNDLIRAIECTEGESVLKEIFNRLKEYTKQHFMEEEAYMKEINYPGLETHTAEHVLLMVRVNTLWRLVQSGERFSPKGVALFITDWIVGHIMEQDGKIGKYAQSQSIANAQS